MDAPAPEGIVTPATSCAELGATQYIQASRYADEHEFDAILARLEDLISQFGHTRPA